MEIKAFVLNYISLFLLFTLLVDALIADWTLNPIHDVLFARISGPIFYMNHASVVVFLCSIGLVRILQSRLTIIAPWCFAIFATASIHELALGGSDIIVGGFDFAGLALSPKYALYLTILLVAAIIYCKPFQRRVLVYMAIGVVSFFFTQIIWEYPGTVGSTILGFNPTANFYNPSTNFWEVVNWLVPGAMWLMPKSWMQHATGVELWLRQRL